MKEPSIIEKQTAVLAKEKEFPQWGKGLFDMYPYSSTPLVYYVDDTTNNIWFNMEPENRIAVAVPQYLLQKWLREKHTLHIEISFELHMKWFYQITKCPYTEADDVISYCMDEGFENYEQALEKGLFEALKLI